MRHATPNPDQPDPPPSTDPGLEAVYAQLRRVAGSYFRHERAAHTLQPTALVHEAFLQLAESPDLRWTDEARFAAVAATAMRHILIDHARGRGRLKRGGDRRRLRLDTMGALVSGPDDDAASAVDLLALDEALGRLAELDPPKARLVELRFFAGMSLESAAEAMDIARSTASEHWRTARAWLHAQLKDDDA